MIPVEALMSGLEFRSPDYNVANPVDFAAEGARETLVFFAGWWRADWITREGLELIPDILRERDRHWYFGDSEDLLLGPAGDGDMEFRLNRMRRLNDTNRDEYLQALQVLKETEVGFDFDPWIAATLERPRIDPVAEFKAKNEGLRKIGRLFLLNQDNERVDVLVLDEHGNAATAGGNDWLEAFGDRWADLDPRPDLSEFLAWLATQRAYGPFSLDAPVVLQKEGSIEDLAISMAV